MGSDLNPTALTRLRQGIQPDWVHTVRARRAAAAALVVLAGVAAVRANPHGDRAPTIIAARDLTPGIALSADDVHLESRPVETLPDGAQSQLSAVMGYTLTGPVRRGEVITDVRLLGSRLADSAAGTDARIVPLRLADNAVLEVLRAGDVVDILAAPDSDPGAVPRVVARDGVVVLVSTKQKGVAAGADRVVLVALPEAAANSVAGLTLVQSVTLTLH